ncbi:hypothetical protein [Selenomonas sp. oral taxon 892]|uniref:hypothetical protein n=1 Tax=Selenomonas sp. oral taxon 892 TaxID=1321785 RepID=UPI0003AD3EFA|nr:hypothetical protein [Selenomonas sp. oral taxon 892]ERJ95369.1 hypothetical protein HMPREF1992_00613 [Selenomonas sp. oral taxon 892 str. F0426]
MVFAYDGRLWGCTVCIVRDEAIPAFEKNIGLYGKDRLCAERLCGKDGARRL